MVYVPVTVWSNREGTPAMEGVETFIRECDVWYDRNESQYPLTKEELK
jgi:hypothetical protein